VSDQTDEVLYEVRDAVARIVWNRPERLNALSPSLLDAFRAALARADSDPAVRVIVFSGAGRAFSSGGDIVLDRARTGAGLPEGVDVGEYMLAMRTELLQWHADYIRLAEMRTPVIAQVHGWCLGGGAWMAVAADITIAADDTVFGQPEVRQGMPSGAVWALAAGWKNALRYALTGDHLDAAEALRIGLVNEVVPRAQLDARVGELARRIALLPPEASELNKRMVRRAADAMGFREALMTTAEVAGWLMGAWRPDGQGAFDARAAREGFSAAARARDDPFRPEPFGPRSESGSEPGS
jgi:enoyl-CoA hydratase/carnithine racemase